jgi:hypothetical protein
MWRLLLILSILPIIVALLARWWFGLRILAKHGRHLCHCDAARWQTTFQTAIVPPSGELPARDIGANLRRISLAMWAEQDPRAAKSREGARTFGLAVPPLSALIAVFAMLVAKIPFTGALAVFLAATALAALIGLLSLAPELRAIARAARKLRESRTLRRSDDEEAVIASAIAHAWAEATPPVFRLIQR